jgi:hypothetical protein
MTAMSAVTAMAAVTTMATVPAVTAMSPMPVNAHRILPI